MSLTDDFKRLINSWPDAECKCIVDNLTRFPDRARAERDLADRVEKVAAGLQRQVTLPPGVVRELELLDPRLRLRWDFDAEAWAVDRAIFEYQWWQPITFWTPDKSFFGHDGLIECLRRHDMQRFQDPKEYLRMKREAARKVREANAKAANDRIVGVIDGMTDKQVEQFMAVERALITGEKIRSTGPDAEFLNAAYEATQAERKMAADAGVELRDNVCINPGMKPGSGYTRDRKGEDGDIVVVER